MIWTEQETEAQRDRDSVQGHTSGKRQDQGSMPGRRNPGHTLPSTWPLVGPLGLVQRHPETKPRAVAVAGLRLCHPCCPPLHRTPQRHPVHRHLTPVSVHQLMGRCQGCCVAGLPASQPRKRQLGYFCPAPRACGMMPPLPRLPIFFSESW